MSKKAKAESKVESKPKGKGKKIVLGSHRP
jgi:hypothetical protein